MTVPTESEFKKTGRIYGRGFADGLRKAGLNPDEHMNKHLRNELSLDGMSGVAKKVFEFVPIGEAWNSTRIGSEIARVTNATVDRKTLDGCLSALTEAKLIRETSRGLFQRAPEKPRMVEPLLPRLIRGDMPGVAQDEAAQPPAPTGNALDRLAAAAHRMRELAGEYTALANEVENIALDAEKQIEAAQQDGEKARQLRALLKDFA